MADSKLTALSEISVPALEDLLYWVDDPSGTPASDKCSANRAFGLLNHVCQGMLTLESGVPVSTSDQTAKTSVYFTPYSGNKIAIYDGTRWKMYSFSELTLALGTLTSDKNYDVFIYDNAGTLTLEATAWTNDTTRATAYVLQDGVPVKSGATTRRLLGTFRTTSTTTTEDSLAKRFLSNWYNHFSRPMMVQETTNSWTYGTNSWRPMNNSTANRVQWVACKPTPVKASAVVMGLGSGAKYPMIGIGYDSTSVASSLNGAAYEVSNLTIVALYEGMSTEGYHYLQALERAGTGASTSFYGDNGADGSQSGICGRVVG